MKKLKKFNYIVKALLTLLVFVVASAFIYSGQLENLLGIASGVSLAVIAVTNVTRPTAQLKAGNQTGYRVWLVHVANVDTDNIPLADTDNQTLADIPLLAGAKWFYIDAKKASVIPKFQSEGDDGLQVTKTIEVQIEGLEQDARKFLDKNKGGDFFIVWELCATGKKFIAGTKCSGLTLTVTEAGWMAERTGATIQLASTCPQIPYEYLGTTPVLNASTVAANATAIPLVAGNNVYALSAGSSSAANVTTFSGVTAADHGRIVKVLGTSNTFPSTIDNDDDFLLKDGATWTANDGASITFQVFKDGSATYMFIEISRVTV